MRSLQTQGSFDGRCSIATILRFHAIEPTHHHVWILLHPRGSCLRGILSIIQDRAHDLVFHGQREFQVFQQCTDIFALPDIALGDIGIDRRAPQIGAEKVVTTLELRHLEIGVHRMRFPAEEHDRFASLGRFCRLREHPGFR